MTGPVRDTAQTGSAPAVSASARDQITDWVTGTIAAAGADISGVRVRLSAPPGTGLAVGQVNLTSHSRALRVQAATAYAQDAGLRLIERLARQIALFGDGWAPRPWPDPLHEPAPALPRRPGSALVVRRKNVALELADPTAALRRLDALDHQAYLFTDRETGLDALVHRGGPFGYRLIRTAVAAPHPAARARLVTSTRPAPTVTLATALMRLAATGYPYLFFTDLTSRRGALLYRRYAGGYGLVRPTR